MYFVYAKCLGLWNTGAKGVDCFRQIVSCGYANQNPCVQTNSPVRAVRRITRVVCWLSALSSQNVLVPRLWMPLQALDGARPSMSIQPSYMMSWICSQVCELCVSCLICTLGEKVMATSLQWHAVMKLGGCGKRDYTLAGWLVSIGWSAGLYVEGLLIFVK